MPGLSPCLGIAFPVSGSRGVPVHSASTNANDPQVHHYPFRSGPSAVRVGGGGWSMQAKWLQGVESKALLPAKIIK